MSRLFFSFLFLVDFFVHARTPKPLPWLAPASCTVSLQRRYQGGLGRCIQMSFSSQLFMDLLRKHISPKIHMDCCAFPRNSFFLSINHYLFVALSPHREGLSGHATPSCRLRR